MPERLISACPACGCAAAEQSLEVGPGDKVLRTEGTIGPFDGEQPPESAETWDAGGSLRTPGSQAREAEAGLAAVLASRLERARASTLTAASVNTAS